MCIVVDFTFCVYICMSSQFGIIFILFLKVVHFWQNRDETNKRDYLYYLAVGNTKLKEYATALKYIRALLQVEPGNRQAQVGLLASG